MVFRPSIWNFGQIWRWVSDNILFADLFGGKTMKGIEWIAWAIKNSVVLICFSALAIYFNYWWIVLFAALFISDIKTRYEKRDGE